MKKLISITTALILSISLFSGCAKANNNQNATQTPSSSKTGTETNPQPLNDSSVLKDGVYKATYDKPDQRGWKPQLEITIKDKKITDAKYDYVSTNGVLKTTDEAYEKNMKAKQGVGPQEYVTELRKQLLDKQDPSKIDGVTGATQSTSYFKELTAAILVKAQKGDTSETVLPLGDKLQDKTS